MVKNSDKTYGQLIQEARQMTDRQEVGDTVRELLKYFKNLIDETCQQQAENCMSKGFTLPKYYIWIRLRKDDLTSNALHILPQARVTRPTKDQAKDHFLWSVTNLNQIKYEWSVISNELANFIIANKHQFHPHTVAMTESQLSGKIEPINEYLVNGKLA